MHAPLLTDRAALEVHPGETEEEIADGLDRSGGRRRLAQERATAGELGGPATIGEQAEVADAHEAVGHDVLQEAADELRGRQGHDLHPVAVGVVVLRDLTKRGNCDRLPVQLAAAGREGLRLASATRRR